MLLRVACAMAVLTRLSAEFVFVREVQSGLCVEVSGSGNVDSPVRLLDCEFGVQNSKQVWYFGDDEFVIVWTQLCADVYPWGIGLWPCRSPADPSTSQVWQVNGGVVVNRYWGTCLTPHAPMQLQPSQLSRQSVRLWIVLGTSSTQMGSAQDVRFISTGVCLQGPVRTAQRPAFARVASQRLFSSEMCSLACA